MGATFKEIAHKQIQEYMEQWYADAYKELKTLSKNILATAILVRREQEEAHEFTGNLLNSIAVVLVCSDNVKKVLKLGDNKFLLTAKDAHVKPAEYTGLGFYRGNKGGLHDMLRDKRPMQKGYAYDFEWDYEGVSSKYHKYSRKGKKYFDPAEAEGGSGYKDSIEEWSRKITRTKGDYMFEIHVGYTAPYAEWVELHRGTIGAEVAAEESKLYFEAIGLK